MTAGPPGADAARRVLVLAVDLMDRSRFQEAAPEGVTVELFRRPAALWAALTDPADPAADPRGPVLVVLDLTRPGAVDEVPADLPPRTAVVGYGPHVDDELLARARVAGFDDVLPRSVLFRRLGAILSDGAGDAADTDDAGA